MPFAAAWRLVVDQHGPKQAARLFAQVLGAVVERGEHAVAQDLVVALKTGEPIQLAVRTRTHTPPLASEQVPERLAAGEVQAGSASDYDTLLGGVK